VLSEPAIERLAAADIKELILTDSVPLPEEKRLPFITTLSVAELFARAIKRIHQGQSVSRLFRESASADGDEEDEEDDVEDANE
jgi:ribose-phosphate pyrophosphokinase